MKRLQVRRSSGAGALPSHCALATQRSRSSAPWAFCSVWLALLLSLCLAPEAQAQAGKKQELVRVRSVPLPSAQRALDAAWRDVDGDGAKDLCLALGPTEGQGRRSLALHRQLPTGSLEPEASLRIELPQDVVAFALADLDPAPGIEFALLTPKGAYALRPNAAEAERFVRLAELDCLWQLPDPEQLVHWSRAVADLDGDGLDDLLVPSSAGYHLLLQRRSEGVTRFEARFCPLLLPLPLAEGQAALRVTSASADSTLEVRLGGSLGVRTLVAVNDEVPAPFLLDADGDKRLELLAQDETQLQWFAGSSTGPAVQGESLPSPVVVDERRALDVSFASLLGDISGDGRVDWVLLAGDQRASKARTQILIHHQKVPTRDQPRRFVSTPDAVLVIDGFAGDPRLYDLNGDGRLDLSLAALRPDLLQALTQGSLDRYELEQYVYLNEAGKLQRRPILAERLSFRSEDSLPTLEFVRDRSGDKVADLFWRPEAGKLRLSMVMTRGERWALNSTPLFELGIDARARILSDSVAGRGALAPPLDHALVVGPRDVQVLEF